MCDILCTVDDIASTLSHQTTEFMISHPFQAWHHTPCIRHHTNCTFVITDSLLVSPPLLYYITPTVSVPSYALYITSHPLCWWHTTLSIYAITCPLLMTSHALYMTCNLLCMISHSLYRQHHTNNFCGITLAIYVASFALYRASQPHFLTSNHHFGDIKTTILDIFSTVSVSSHQLYRCYTTNICMISHPEYVRHSVHCIYDIVPTMYDLTTLCVDYTTFGICMTSFALQKMSHPLYHTKPQSLWIHIHFRHDITSPVSDITQTVSL